MHHRSLIAVLAVLAVYSLAGCAPGPLSIEGANLDITPAEARTEPSAAQGETVVWGGRIVATQNQPERTRLEIVAYPITAHAQRPNRDQEPLGRFRAYQAGYLETAAYSPGREVTVRGIVTGTEEGRIDAVTYTYPTVDIEAIKLWEPRAQVRREEPRFHFGFGIIRRY